MSGIDPLAALTARVAAAEAAMLEAAIDLGLSAQALQAQISTGDVLAAKILPAQNGQDVIEILGRRVVAQLPPGVHPGETLLLQVTDFSGRQIVVRNLGTPDARDALPVTNVVLSELPAEAPAPATSAQVSPPREVFVAASVRQTPAPQAPAPAAPSTAVLLQGIEARIAASQTAKGPPVTPPPAQNAVTPPLIPARGAAAQNAAVSAVQRAAQTVSEFLRATRLPDTPFTRMAATIAPHAPERLPSVLQRLDAALPRVSDDARISTLRTLIGFTSKLNPANAETLRAQISAYVSNVVEGVEAKLGQLLQAHAQAQPQRPENATPRAPQNAQPEPDTPPVSATVAQARVAERSAAISHDLKSVVLSLLRDPPATRTPAMSQALSETLITLTGAQVNALSSTQQNPGTFNITLPVYYHEGGKPAQIRISRDAESRAKMDADNFHVAFVLDTANLGTVAIDLHTTGRTVKVDVKTETKPAAERFSDSLSALRGRLEDMRYRVASAVAGALPARAAPAKNDVAPTARTESKRGLDFRA